MKTLLLLLPFLTLQQDGFTHFSFCREVLGGAGELQCLELSPTGEGLFRLGAPDDDPLERAMSLTASTTETYLELLAATDYLLEGDTYESESRVAAVGMKTLIVEGDWGRREAEFNYSSRSEVMNLVRFFERLIALELVIVDIENARRFAPLSLPEILDGLERDLRMNRLEDTSRLAPVLGEIAEDGRVVTLARNHAAELKEDVED